MSPLNLVNFQIYKNQRVPLIFQIGVGKCTEGGTNTKGKTYPRGVPIRPFLHPTDSIIYFTPPIPSPRDAPGAPLYIGITHENILGSTVLNLRNKNLQKTNFRGVGWFVTPARSSSYHVGLQKQNFTSTTYNPFEDIYR